MKPIDWHVAGTDGDARAGIIKTRRSVIETPVFLPVGTQGAVKGVRFEWLESELDARIILANTYHLYLRPGAETIRKLGGLHRFSTWERSVLTDSGGFQVFSLADLRRITEDGVQFRSHIDGSTHFLSPETSMEIQAALGSDIVMALDECLPGEIEKEKAEASVEMTARWAKRSKDRFDHLQETNADTGNFGSLPGLTGRQALFGIVQGGCHLDLRRESLERTVGIGFDGYAIGGLSVGEEKSIMYHVIQFLAPKMPANAPRYLMGVGTPEDLIEAVGCGVDMFDCVLPTRNGRTGGVFTSEGKLNIRNSKFAHDSGPLDSECECSVCRRYSRAYLRHLYQASEIGAAVMLSHHNVAFFLDTLRRARAAILAGEFESFKNEYLEKMKANDEAVV